MSNKVTLGGDRLGAGGKRQVERTNYGRSTHDLSFVWRNTNSIGTIVPCLNMVALPGDDWDIDIDMLSKTTPSIGPLFGSFKAQIDVFLTPIGLYNANMYMNQLNKASTMNTIKLPLVKLVGKVLDQEKNLDSQQVNSSCIFNYLGIRGIGNGVSPEGVLRREFNAVPWLIYHDVVKNYYANKQEGIGFVIHNDMAGIENTPTMISLHNGQGYTQSVTEELNETLAYMPMYSNATAEIQLTESENWTEWELSRIRITLALGEEWFAGTVGETVTKPITELFDTWIWDENANTVRGSGWMINQGLLIKGKQFFYEGGNDNQYNSPKLVPYELNNIDRQRVTILQGIGNNAPIMIGAEEPYIFALEGNRDDGYSITSNQEGLCVKTYQADQFNNWVATEKIEGAGGLNEISAIPVYESSDETVGKIYIQDINVKNKIYNMLMNIAVGDGTINDWQEANWGITRKTGVTNPMYMGGLSSEMVFDEVVSNAQSGDQPLGTLAGRGNLTGKRKGGKLKINVTEPSYITAYVSYTPRIDYSQGNEWDVNLKTMDDFHKPALDEIGFQDLITDKMAFWDTFIDAQADTITFKSAGKIPAWTDYMTNQNKIKGNFAEISQQGWMVNGRNYEPNTNNQGIFIKDLTTYVDPKKWNNIFADTRIDAQNIWTQIAFDISCRRIMSAKVMPHL